MVCSSQEEDGKHLRLLQMCKELRFALVVPVSIFPVRVASCLLLQSLLGFPAFLLLPLSQACRAAAGSC